MFVVAKRKGYLFQSKKVTGREAFFDFANLFIHLLMLIFRDPKFL